MCFLWARASVPRLAGPCELPVSPLGTRNHLAIDLGEKNPRRRTQVRRGEGDRVRAPRRSLCAFGGVLETPRGHWLRLRIPWIGNFRGSHLAQSASLHFPRALPLPRVGS